MRLGGQMQHGIGAIVTKYPADVGGVADINALEMILGVTGDARDRVEIAGIRELVEVDDSGAVRSHERADRGRTDETGSPGDDYALRSLKFHGVECRTFVIYGAPGKSVGAVAVPGSR